MSGRIRHGRMALTMGLYRRRPVLTILQRGTNQESMGAPRRYSVCFMNSSPGISDAPCPRVTDVLVQCASPNKKPEGELLTTSDAQQTANAFPDVFRAPVRAQEPLASELSEILPVENGAGWSLEGGNHHLVPHPLAPFEISSPVRA